MTSSQYKPGFQNPPESLQAIREKPSMAQLFSRNLVMANSLMLDLAIKPYWQLNASPAVLSLLFSQPWPAKLKHNTSPHCAASGSVFLFSVFQLMAPLLLRPGYWSRRKNTD